MGKTNLVEIKCSLEGMDEFAAKVERLSEIMSEAKALAGALASHGVAVSFQVKEA